MTNICIVSSHRAERGLLQPLIDRLEAHPTLNLDILSLDPDADHVANYEQAGAHYMDKRPDMDNMDNRPDIVIIPCDRAEAMDGALEAFELGIPIIHFHAGDVGTVSKDEMYRHMISLMASVHLCNGPKAKKVVTDLLQAVGRPVGCVYDVGSTILDDLEIDESELPFQPYELVLYHPSADDPELINREIDEIEELLDPDILTVWCEPNGDPGSEIIHRRMKQIDARFYYGSPRDEFLGLVKNCRYFIGNSSSMVCEAPMWLSPEQIIHIGDRNKNRSFDEINPGATDRILGILEVISCSVDT